MASNGMEAVAADPTNIYLIWSYVCQHTSEEFRLTIMPSISAIILCWAFHAIFLFFHFFPNLSPIEKYKVQPEKRESNSKICWMIANVVFNQLTSVLLASTGYANMKALGRQAGMEGLPSVGRLTVEMIICAFLYDFFFYFIHRLMHTKWLYKNVHYVHHSSRTSMTLTQSYFHPLDFFFSLLAAGLPPFLISNHVVTTAAWLLVISFESLTAHSGYDLPIFPDPGPHDFHHSHPARPANFGSFFLVWDRLLGTFEPYQQYLHEKNHATPKKGL